KRLPHSPRFAELLLQAFISLQEEALGRPASANDAVTAQAAVAGVRAQARRSGGATRPAQPAAVRKLLRALPGPAPLYRVGDAARVPLPDGRAAGGDSPAGGRASRAGGPAWARARGGHRSRRL